MRREVSVVAAGAVLYLVFLDLLFMTYLPFAYVWRLFPFEFASQAVAASTEELDRLGLERIGRNQIQEGLECGIFLSPMIHPCRPLACSHLFEESVIVQWARKQNLMGPKMWQICPYCRVYMLSRDRLESAHINEQRALCNGMVAPQNWLSVKENSSLLGQLRGAARRILREIKS